MSDNGVEIIDRGWIRYRKALKALNGASILFGFMDGDNPGLVEAIRRNEFGVVLRISRRQHWWLRKQGLEDVGAQIVIPERSFIRSSFDEGTDEITDRTAIALREITDGGEKRKALDGLAKFCVSLIHKKLDSGDFTPNDPFTRERKGYDKKPLEDRGALKNGIDKKVIL